MILPPQLLILSLFQILLDVSLYNTLTGLILVYVATQHRDDGLYSGGFFAQIPQDLFDAARMDGYSDFEIFWRVTLPIGAPAIFTTVTLNFIVLWNEFLLRRGAADRRRQAHIAARASCTSSAVTNSTSEWPPRAS